MGSCDNIQKARDDVMTYIFFCMPFSDDQESTEYREVKLHQWHNWVVKPYYNRGDEGSL